MDPSSGNHHLSSRLKETTRIEGLFNQLAKHYDLINRVLSWGIDQRWRKKLSAQLIITSPNMKLLDIATGTGDQIISLCKTHAAINSAIGIDLSENMLNIGRKKVKQRNLSSIIQLRKGNATHLPFNNNTVDIVSCSFGLRNIDDLPLALSEIRRVLKPGGQLLILEFSLPKNKVIKGMYLGYFRYILPVLGNLFSSHPDAYTYLNRSVEQFPYGIVFADMLRDHQYTSVKVIPLSFGISTIYTAQKLKRD